MAGGGAGVPALKSDVHVWRIDLDGADIEACRSALGPAELAKADRFVFARDRCRYMAAHAALRGVLSFYTGHPPARLDILETQQGKPFLADGRPAFSLSHSGGTALVAVAIEGQVGVDIEHVAPRNDEIAIARSLFARREVALLEGLPDEARRALFFELWTCREAVLKAAGTGLGGGGLEIGYDDAGRVHVVSSPPQLSGNIALRVFKTSQGQQGAVAWTSPSTSGGARFFGFDKSVDPQ